MASKRDWRRWLRMWMVNELVVVVFSRLPQLAIKDVVDEGELIRVQARTSEGWVPQSRFGG
jgi:hypothetical protein